MQRHNLVLSWDSRFKEADGQIEVRHGCRSIAITGVSLKGCRELLDRLDGRHAFEDLVRDSGLSTSDCDTLISSLVQHGFAREAGHTVQAEHSGAQFAQICRDLIPGWKTRLFSHPLWVGLRDGSAPRPVFEGWVLENFHFIEGVTLRLGAAIAFCQDPAISKHFAKHFSEEYDHCWFFRESLQACGVTDHQLNRSKPLSATSAVLNWMREAARRDPLCYACCSAFLESTGADRDNARKFFEQLTRTYGNEAVTPLARHADLDEEYGHGGFLEKICSELHSIDYQRANAAIQCMWGLVETLEFWSAAVLRHYSAVPALQFLPVQVFGQSLARPVPKSGLS